MLAISVLRWCGVGYPVQSLKGIALRSASGFRAVIFSLVHDSKPGTVRGSRRTPVSRSSSPGEPPHPGPHRTVREPLDSYGSCHPVVRMEGRTCQCTNRSGRSDRGRNVYPRKSKLVSGYRPGAGHVGSRPVVSSGDGARARRPGVAPEAPPEASTPDAAWPVDGLPPDLSRSDVEAPVLASDMNFRRVINDSLAFV